MKIKRTYATEEWLHDEERPQKVIDFLEEVTALCEKYGFVIGHEDSGGGFLIYDQKATSETTEWFAAAAYVYRSGGNN